MVNEALLVSPVPGNPIRKIPLIREYILDHKMKPLIV